MIDDDFPNGNDGYFVRRLWEWRAVVMMLLGDDAVIMMMSTGLLVRKHDARRQWEWCVRMTLDNDDVGGAEYHYMAFDWGI